MLKAVICGAVAIVAMIVTGQCLLVAAATEALAQVIKLVL